MKLDLLQKLILHWSLSLVHCIMLLHTNFLIEPKTSVNSVSVSKVLMSIKNGSPYASVGIGRSGCIKVLPELLTTNAYVLWPWLKNVISDNRSSTWISVPTTPIKFPLWKQGKVIVIIRPVKEKKERERKALKSNWLYCYLGYKQCNTCEEIRLIAREANTS